MLSRQFGDGLRKTDTFKQNDDEDRCKEGMVDQS